MQHILDLISLWALPFIILLILTFGLVKKVPLYESFTTGAKLLIVPSSLYVVSYIDGAYIPGIAPADLMNPLLSKPFFWHSL